ncbi:hypothetical protein LX32DRAFT_138113 [Colletotrichum zoysiae]|uniref:Uncharacterized protein n=1 Tax=Colletotrichum zoysiae TaxID=1216348 RepID=A0AAD9M4G7_9PEZI|nr:hypothetical protein LX32DRAFT_138113 [Colletotrichum zoysiae]
MSIPKCVRWSGLVLLPFSSTLIIHNALLPIHACLLPFSIHTTDTSILASPRAPHTGRLAVQGVSLPPILLPDLARLGTSVPRTPPSSHLVSSPLPPTRCWSSRPICLTPNNLGTHQSRYLFCFTRLRGFLPTITLPTLCARILLSI